MKLFYVILFLLLVKCCSPNVITHTEENTFYFYFKHNDSTMKKYYSGQDPVTENNVGPLKYLYVLDSIDNIIFANKKNKSKRKKISVKDTSKMNIKTISWLNKMHPDREKRYNFFNNKKHTLHIIEKDTVTNQLYLIENMTTIDEIE